MLAAGHPSWPVSRREQSKPLLLKYQDASEKKKPLCVCKVCFPCGGVLLLLQPRELGIHCAVIRQLCNEQGKRENRLTDSTRDLL